MLQNPLPSTPNYPATGDADLMFVSGQAAMCPVSAAHPHACASSQPSDAQQACLLLTASSITPPAALQYWNGKRPNDFYNREEGCSHWSSTVVVHTCLVVAFSLVHTRVLCLFSPRAGSAVWSLCGLGLRHPS